MIVVYRPNQYQTQGFIDSAIIGIIVLIAISEVVRSIWGALFEQSVH